MEEIDREICQKKMQEYTKKKLKNIQKNYREANKMAS